MKLIIGLGNPGNKYEGTRHNIGFDVIDEVLARNNLSMTEQKFRADFTIWHHPEGKVILMQPFTYMNLSGEAVLPLMSYYGIGIDDILVVHDDLDLEPGNIRIRQKGSSGGQKGVQSIINMLGTNEFNRFKIGIGRPRPGWKVTDHVLAPFTSEETEKVEEAIVKAAEAIEYWLSGAEFTNVMNQYN